MAYPESTETTLNFESRGIKPGSVYIGPYKDDGRGHLTDAEGRPVFWVCYETGEYGRLWESFEEWWEELHWPWTTRWLRPFVKPFAELAFWAGRRSSALITDRETATRPGSARSGE